MVADSLNKQFSMHTFIALPAAMNSKLLRWALLERFAAPVNCTVCGVAMWLTGEISPQDAVESMNAVEYSVVASAGSLSAAAHSA